MNRGRSQQRGFTLVEVLIFLAVTSGLFIAAMLYISGQQGKAEFTQGVRDFELKLGDVVNNVSTGFYPTLNNIKCTANAGAVDLQTSAGQEQGANNDCIFVGRVIQLAPDGDQEKYMLYTAAGLRYKDGNTTTDVTSLDEANPTLITVPGSTDLLSFGGAALSVKKVQYVHDGSAVDVGGFAIFTTFESLAGMTNGNRNSHVQVVVPLASVGTLMAESSTDFVTKMNTLGDANTLSNPNGGVRICLDSGASRQHVWVKLGGDNVGTLTTSTEYGSDYC